jgi:hypothetical protein
MSNRMIWVGILIVVAVTLVTVANCRNVPDPWVPQAGGDAATAPP